MLSATLPIGMKKALRQLLGFDLQIAYLAVHI
jgi:hypothetical protein